MNKFSKLLIIPFVIVALGSCDDDASNNTSTSTPPPSIEITSDNASQFFSVKAQGARKGFENGYVMHYLIEINLIGNYKLKTDLDLTVKTTADYWPYDTSDTLNLTMEKGTNSISKEDTIIFAKHLDEIENITWTCTFTKASGYIVAN